MFFVAPKQRSIYDYATQIQKIQSQFLPNNISEKQYLARLQNELTFKPLFNKNVNLSVQVVNDRGSRYNITLKRGFFIMDYVLIEMTQDVVLTIDKQFLINNNGAAIIFASYHYPTNEPVTSTSDCKVGVVAYDLSSQSLFSPSEYSGQAYYLFTNSDNTLCFRIFKFSLQDEQYVEEIVPSVQVGGDTYSCIPSYDENPFAVVLQERILWDFGEY